ncbi:HPr family phosphocarrier protein [Caproiciproducens sp. CPB-2]|uniref:HPr family phosphocarrier protein n=1 Tax=unclassified Caproiciproducens TaxID=2643836 RepID=UPI0023DAFE75|nr:HPr family phosphocarrier protein [Caproiciproducens sp. CPB-2]MDF1495262.1 HPr family phosphocarrier protein [Caproiciproducens sp. CPB-2]
MVQVRVMDRNGLHARPASRIAGIALAHPGAVYLEKDGVRCNAKKVMEIMGFNFIYGDLVSVIAPGRSGDQVEKSIGSVIMSSEDH